MMSVALVLYPPEAIELPRMLSADAKHHRNLAVVIIENHGAFGAVQSVRAAAGQPGTLSGSESHPRR